jgi:hypothetical protein
MSIQDCIRDLDKFNFIDFYNGNNVITINKVNDTQFELVTYIKEKKTSPVDLFGLNTAISELLNTKYMPQIKYTPAVNMRVMTGGKKEIMIGLNDQMIKAIESNDLKKCEALILKGANPKLLAQSKDPKIVHLCIKYADPIYINPLVKLLECMTEENKEYCIKQFERLVKKGHNPYVKDINGKNAMKLLEKRIKK